MVTISKDLEATLYQALQQARERRHEYLTVEHVLYAMLNDPVAKKVLVACGGNLRQLKDELERFFIEQMTPLGEEKDRDPVQTPAFQRVLERAAIHVQSAGRNSLDAGQLLAAFFREPESHAVYLLEKQGISRLDVISYLSHGQKKSGTDSGTAKVGGEDDEEAGYELAEGDEKGQKNPLEAFTTDLNARARAGLIDPLIGREHELERTIQILCRRRKNNPIFVGEAGVGKTAIVEGLAKAIVEERVPEVLKDAVIYSLDMGSLIAGTKFRGEFEERLKGVLAQLKKHVHAILFIDEIHTIYGAGATSGGAMDASNLLKPALASGELHCMGSTTFNDYKAVFEKDHALARRFQKIDVHEPSVEESYLILKGLKSAYEEHHQVEYTDLALRTAAELSAKHINDRLLPDKAIDVIDEAGAVQRMRKVEDRQRIIDKPGIEAVIAKIARIPTATVSVSDRDKLADLEGQLKQVIYGQDKAVENLVSVIKLSRSGLGSPEKPIGSFLFSGPTGVGKTELAKQLAKAMGVEFIRFDMSEYMEKHTVSRLIGAPPGYVGFDQGGMLTDAIRKTPHAVLVLDEIEKAHPDLFNILLQVMDHATLTDNNGRKADFRHVVVIMTTNAGAQELVRDSLGFSGGAPHAHRKDKAAVEKTFSPEFRNRLDGWITFGTLSKESIEKVVDKFVEELRVQLKPKKVALELTAKAREWLSEHGYDRLYGARPMGRLIQNDIKRPLADAILFGVLSEGGVATVDVEADKIALKYTAAPSADVATEPIPAVTH